MTKLKYLVSAALLGLLAACGGGGSSSSGPSSELELPKSAPDARFLEVANTSSQARAVPLNMPAAAGKTVRFMLTNGSSLQESNCPEGSDPLDYCVADARMTGFNANVMQEVAGARVLSSAVAAMPAQAEKDREMAELGQEVMAKLKPASASEATRFSAQAVAVQAVLPAVQSKRDWIACQTLGSNFLCLDENPNVPTTLAAQKTVSMGVNEDAWTVNIWVADSEYGTNKVTDEMAEQLAEAYAGQQGIYKLTRQIGGGNPWGYHSFPDVVATSTRVIDVVMLNITPDSRPYGIVGYFSSLNLLKKSYLQAGTSSNEALAVFLDAETAYLANNGMNIMKTTLAHEATHLRNFYFRQLKMMGAQFPLWMEEMTAMGFEELAAGALTPGYSPAESSRLPYLYAYNSANCNLMDFNSAAGQCHGYAVGGSFMAYMLRNYGTEFLSKMMSSMNFYPSRVFKQAFDGVGTDFATATRQWHQATFGGFSPATAPEMRGYPARTVSRTYPDVASFELKQLNPQVIGARYTPYQSAPTALVPGGSHVWQSNPSAGLNTTVTVPAGTVLTVAIN